MLVLVRFCSEVKPPATKTRLPTTSMSQISPVLIRGMVVSGVSGTSAVWFGFGWRCGPTFDTVTGRVVVTVALPSLTLRVTVRVPELA